MSPNPSQVPPRSGSASWRGGSHRMSPLAFTNGKARAIENKVFLVASGYDYPTYVMDPDGEILSEARQRGAAAIATIDLNKRYVHPQLGDMRERRMKELRLDVKPPLPGFEN